MRTGETYYLVIDYDKPIDEEAEIYETYLLNLVDNRDLLAVLAEDEKPTPVPTPTPAPVPTAAPTVQLTEPNTGSVNTAGMFALMLLGLIVGGGTVWFVMSHKSGGKEQKLMDEYMITPCDVRYCEQDDDHRVNDHRLPQCFKILAHLFSSRVLFYATAGIYEISG